MAVGLSSEGRASREAGVGRIVEHFLRLLSATPEAPSDWVADRLGDGAYRSLGAYRANVLANLAQVSTASANAPAARVAVRDVFRAAARNFVDLARASGCRDAPERRVQVDEGDWRTFEEARGLARGVVVVTAHLGPFDQLPAILAARGAPVRALTTRTTDRRAFAIATRLRRAHGAAVDEAGLAALRGLIRHLDGGGCVGFAADCDHAGTGVPVEFFGGATTLPSIAVRLARSTGAPIVPIFTRRTLTGIALSIRAAIVVDRSTDHAGDVACGMRLVAAQLERAIAADPGQWVVFRRVWPANPSRPEGQSGNSGETAA